MKEIVTDKFIMKVANFQNNVEISCPERCGLSKNGFPNKCSSGNDIMKTVDNNKMKIAIIKLIIKNISTDLQAFDKQGFDIVDSLGFIYRPMYICSDIHIDNRAMTNQYELPPNTQIYFNLYTIPFEENTTLSKVHYSDDHRICHTIDVTEVSDDIVTSEEKLRIENYKLSEEFKKLQEERTRRKKVDNENEDKEPVIHYKTEEDDVYFYFISDEKDKLLSFHRRFDLKKSNYNWVNEKEPLITLTFDDQYDYMFDECKIDSPTTGIFEFEKKRFIAYNEVIGRIRKYTQQQKDEVFREMEKQVIKETLLNRERKKILEREALDELISDGLVFNTYVDKMGNRTKIPNDVANAVWNRDGGRCCFCGSRENLEFDHIIPISKGGATTFPNLQLLCKPCNVKKSNKIG